jgi:pimeloyl-ACP methyl ester carboxylesterase
MGESMDIRADAIIEANGVDLCAETFGDRGDPAILLIMGSSASMDWWEDKFCERLAAGSRFVIRYDHRDTGRSVSYEPGAPPYSIGDLVADAIGLLDAFELPRAHLVGMSMGGGIAQLVALESPERVASLTLISTSLADRDGSDLPPMPEEIVAEFDVARPDWSDRAAVIDHLTHLARVSASRSRVFDEAAFRELAGRVFDRSADIEATMTNHDLIRGGYASSRRLEELAVPTLVFHGTDDPVLPFAHGLALVEAIPGARLLALGGTGHELPRRVWNLVAPAIIDHTGSAEAP